MANEGPGLRRKLVSVVTPCFNESGNVEQLIERIRAQFALLPEHDFEHILIDNASTDDTVARVRGVAVRHVGDLGESVIVQSARLIGNGKAARPLLSGDQIDDGKD